MKIFKPLIVFTIAALSLQCDALDDLTKFDLDYESSVTIPSNSLVNLPFTIETPAMQTNSEDISLKSMRLTITTPADKTFSFLESIEIFISAEGVDEISLAALNPVSANATGVINLDTTDADLKEYIKKDSFNLRIQSVTDEVIDEDVQIDILSVFAVDAKILGI